MKMKIQALYLTGTALLIGAAGVGDSITFDAVGSWTGAAIVTVLMAAGGIVCWGYGRGLEIEQAEKAQLAPVLPESWKPAASCRRATTPASGPSTRTRSGGTGNTQSLLRNGSRK